MKVSGVVLLFGVIACSSTALRPSTGDAGATGSAAGATGNTGGAGGHLGTAGSAGAAAPGQEIYWTINRDIDVLFMVDDSLSMEPLQKKLRANFPAFMDVLKGLPLPNLHLAVVSSDLGAGKTGAPGCNANGGDQGKFQFSPKDPVVCANAQLKAGQNYIANINGVANYTGDISDAFSCIAALGQSGCGLEHQFGSTLRALGADGAGAPSENAGFLRPEAFLAVILVTNEDDCSAPRDSDVFTATSQYVSDPLGPLTSYRCNYVGHLCDGQKPARMSGGGPYNNCVSAEDGALLRVSDVVAGLKGLKRDPNKILVAALTGPPKPYVVIDDSPASNDDPATVWPTIEHSCTQPDGTFADPSVRIGQFIQAFGANGIFESICNSSFTPALKRIGEEIGKRLSSGQCLMTSSAPSDCTLVDHSFSANGDRVDTPVPACANESDNTGPCWELIADGSCGADHRVNVLGRDPNKPLSRSSTVTCSH